MHVLNSPLVLRVTKQEAIGCGKEFTGQLLAEQNFTQALRITD
jgi:hypothetical protein